MQILYNFSLLLSESVMIETTCYTKMIDFKWVYMPYSIFHHIKFTNLIFKWLVMRIGQVNLLLA